MTYYLKYRSKNIDELDIREVRESLTKTVKSGKIPHALLFSGPKGTGKTSAARIIAKIVNCEKPEKTEACDKCSQCLSITKGNNLDVIELDAASHRGIDDIRILRDAVKLAPAKAKKKIYIIDEAHMLTAEASNALLKTLEEPPDHVMFILATTNPEKLIGTIKSRTLNIPFRKATDEEIVRSLARIVKGERLKIEVKALTRIAKISEGSFRDAAKILEQIITEKISLTGGEIDKFLSRTPLVDIDNFFDLLAKKETKELLDEIEATARKNVSMDKFLEALLARSRKALLAKVGVDSEDLISFSKEDIIYLIELFTEALELLRITPIEQLPVEMAVVKWVGKGQNTQVAKVEEEKPEEEKAEVIKKEGKSETKQIGPDLKVVEIKTTRALPPTANIDDDLWRTILAKVKPINTSIEALLRAARPASFDGKTLILGVFYRFHKERLEEERYRRILEEVATGVLGEKVKIVCTLTEPPVKKAVEQVKEPKIVLTEGGDKDIIEIAEKIFGN